MKRLPLQRQTLALLAVMVPLLGLFVYVALRSGPLAPVEVTVASVGEASLAPGLFGIGTVEARRTYRIGPTVPGRVGRVLVDVGDRVRAGQLLGEMDPVDLDDRLRAQEATINRLLAGVREAEARQQFALAQADRYQQLLAIRSSSEEIVAARQQDLQSANAALAAVREDLARGRAERDALRAQRGNVRLLAPVDGLVTTRDGEPGTTLVAGQAVLEVIDPATLWLNVRFDQGSAQGLRAGLAARVVLRSRSGPPLVGRVARLEPKADAVTEEILARVTFDALPDPRPPVGELAEVTVVLPALRPAPVIPNAAVQRKDGTTGVWQVVGATHRFTPVTLGAVDLEGQVQVRHGLRVGDRVVVYSAKTLTAGHRIAVVDRIPGAPR